MDHHVRAVLDGTDQIGGPEGIVDDKRDLMLMGYGRQSVDIRNVRSGIAQSLDEDQLCLFIDGAPDLLQIVDVHELCGNAVGGKGMIQEIVAASVDGLLGYHVVSRSRQGQDGIGHRRGSRGDGQSSCSALQGSHSLLQDALGGVGQPSVNVAGVPEAEPVRRVLGAVENVGGGLIDGDRSGIRCRIGLLLSYMQLQCFKFKGMFAHINLLPFSWQAPYF